MQYPPPFISFLLAHFCIVPFFILQIPIGILITLPSVKFFRPKGSEEEKEKRNRERKKRKSPTLLEPPLRHISSPPPRGFGVFLSAADLHIYVHNGPRGNTGRKNVMQVMQKAEAGPIWTMYRRFLHRLTQRNFYFFFFPRNRPSSPIFSIGPQNGRTKWGIKTKIPRSLFFPLSGEGG